MPLENEKPGKNKELFFFPKKKKSEEAMAEDLLMFNAAQSGNVKELEKLIVSSPHLVDEVFGFYRQTPLHAASCNGHLEAVRMLLATSNKSVDVDDSSYATPMYAAAHNGHTAVIDLLVAAGSLAFNKLNTEGWSPLFIAAYKGHADTVRSLFLHERDHPKFNRSPADILDNTGKVKFTPLCAATEQNHVDVVRVLIQLGSRAINRPINGDFLPIHSAASFGRSTMIRELNSHGADIFATTTSLTTVFLAARYNHVDALETLVQCGAGRIIDKPDNQGKTPLFRAVECSHFDVVSTLVRLGSRALDTPNLHGETPMHFAAKNGNLKMLNLLFTLGGKAFNARDLNRGSTPLILAITHGHFEAVKQLVEFGADVDKSDNHQRTPLHVAAENGRMRTLELLIHFGSKHIDSRVGERGSPLFIASEHGYPSAVETLIRLGANTSKKAIKSAVKCATRFGHHLVLETLVRLGYSAYSLKKSIVRKALAYDKFQVVGLLLALGVDISSFHEGLREFIAKKLDGKLTEGHIAETRHRVYFSQSLVGRLLFEADRGAMQQRQTQKRII
ncbi:MAG: hypothetical protein BVN35_20020 [Proteobacteria bacterium ST_bin11]|nr:MAG: hypothetical protein BVN35_20020 [Proteobacteria bacterium ST_bin11]